MPSVSWPSASWSSTQATAAASMSAEEAEHLAGIYRDRLAKLPELPPEEQAADNKAA